jgi:ATP-dependent transcriptional regulator
MTTIYKWLEQFPQEELFKRPKLCVQVAEMYSQAGMIDIIDPLLDKAEEIITSNRKRGKPEDGSNEIKLTAEEITVIRSMIPILRGLKAVCSGHPQQAMDVTQTALESIPKMSLKEQAVLYWVQGWAQRSLGDLNRALNLLNKGTEYARKSGAVLRDIWTDLGNVTRLVGKLPQSIDILENSLQTAIDRDIPNQGNLSRDESFLSFLYYEKTNWIKRSLTRKERWPILSGGQVTTSSQQRM